MNFFQTISNPNLLTFVQMNENIYIDTHYQVGRVFSLSLQMILFSCTSDTKLKVQHTNMSQARSHLHSVGPHPSHASFTAWLPYPHLHGNSSSLGTNVTIPGPNYKYSSWHHFHYSQVKLMEFLHMPKELDDLSDQVIVTLVPNKSSHATMNKNEDRAMKEAWEGWGSTEWRCDLARGYKNLHSFLAWIWCPPINGQDWSLRCPSNMTWLFKTNLSQNNPSQRNPKLEMKTSLEVLNMPITRINKCRALSLQEVELDGWFLILHIILKTCIV